MKKTYLITLIITLIAITSRNYAATIIPTLCRVNSGEIKTIRSGSIAPFSFTIQTSGNYTVQCQSVTPSAFTNFQGNVNNIVQNPGTNISYYFNKFDAVQLGYSLYIARILTMPAMCSKLVTILTK
jgi:hypothetical protein